MSANTEGNVSPGVIALTLAVLAVILMVGFHVMSQQEKIVNSGIDDMLIQPAAGSDTSLNNGNRLGDAVEEAGDRAHRVAHH